MPQYFEFRCEISIQVLHTVAIARSIPSEVSGACSAMEMVPGYGWVTLALTCYILLNQYMSVMVGMAREKFNVPYPTMYALESENKNAKQFNCIQRGHQNCLEFLPVFFAMLLVGGLQYPRFAAFFGFVYVVARFLYFRGYSSGNPALRYGMGGQFHFLALLMLLGCTIGFTLHQFFPQFV